MLLLRQSSEKIMTPLGISPYDPKAGLSVNHYFLKDMPLELINLPTGALIWIINGTRYLIDVKYSADHYGVAWLIHGIYEWNDANIFNPVEELTLPSNHPAIELFQEYSKVTV